MKKMFALGLLFLSVFLAAAEKEGYSYRYLYLELEPGMTDYTLIEDINTKYQAEMIDIDVGGIVIRYDSEKIILPDIFKEKYNEVACVRKAHDTTYSYSDEGERSWILINEEMQQ